MIAINLVCTCWTFGEEAVAVVVGVRGLRETERGREKGLVERSRMEKDKVLTLSGR